MNKTEYQAALLEQYRNPEGMAVLDQSFLLGQGINPLCGDEISVGVKCQDDVITEVRFSARACSVCVASASIMVGLMTRQSTQALLMYNSQLRELLVGTRQEEDVTDVLRPLSLIIDKPSRHKCALLAWEALNQALQER